MSRNILVFLFLSIYLLVACIISVGAEEVNILLTASLEGDTSKVQSLLSQGVDINLADEQGRTALINAVERGHLDLVNFLLDKNANINVKTETGETPFLLAARNGYSQIIKLLMEKSVDAKDYFPAMNVAAKNGYREVVAVLGEKVRLEYNCENTICLAAKYGCNEVIGLFIEEDANLNIKGIDIESEEKPTIKWPPIMFAAAYDRLETAELLLKEGKARSYERDENDKNALMIACEKGNVEMVALLLDHEASITSWDNDGWTPMMYAAKNGRAEVIKLIIERYPKSKFSRKNDKGETALDIATAYNQTEVVEILKAAGAK